MKLSGLFVTSQITPNMVHVILVVDAKEQNIGISAHSKYLLSVYVQFWQNYYIFQISVQNIGFRVYIMTFMISVKTTLLVVCI